jgi:hypothetical protein
LHDELRSHAPAGAVVTVCDVDEIPSRDVLTRAARDYAGPRMMVMDHAILHANWLMAQLWRRAYFAAVEDLDAVIATLSGGGSIEDGPGGGSHLSFLGGPDMIRSKLAAYSHQEFNTDRVVRQSYLDGCFRYGVAPITRELLRPMAPAAGSDLLAQLLVRRPAFVGPHVLPRPGRRRAFAAWALLRSRRFLPEATVRAVDDRPHVVQLVGVLIRPWLRLAELALRRG